MSKTILVVDDSSSLRALVKLSLSRAGYAVLEAGDGQQGLAQVEKAAKINLIVSDVNMPVMDGITFLTEIKKSPRHKFIPVIMLTTEDESTKMQQAKAAGARAWLLKPFDPPALLDAVSRVVLP
jgi:two-component system, chemotaxis family, chemotaxis protein CheY